MARVQMDDDAPQIGRPVGSKEEVEELGVSTRNIATCSLRQDRENFGCPMWKSCDRVFRGTRPQNQVYQITKKGGETRISHGPCFDVVQMELNAEANGGYVEVLDEFKEGMSYISRGSVKRHKKRDPDCDDCQNGRCTVYDDKDDIEFLCPEFPPAAEHRELRKFARSMKARARGRKQKREAIKSRLLEGDGESPRGRKSSS